MLTRRNSVLDARGVRRRVLDMYWAAKPHGLKPSSLARPGDHAEYFPEVVRNCLLPSASGIFALTIFLVARGHFSLRLMLIMSTVVFSVMFVMSFFLTLLIYKVTWRSPINGRDSLLTSGVCPACAYRIAGVPPEHDGCTVCPECGAAWRMQHGPDGRVAPVESVTNGL